MNPDLLMRWRGVQAEVVRYGTLLDLPQGVQLVDVRPLRSARSASHTAALMTFLITAEDRDSATKLSRELSGAVAQSRPTEPIREQSKLGPIDEQLAALPLKLKKRVKLVQQLIERSTITEAIGRARTKTEAARLLGISRPTLDSKLVQLGITLSSEDRDIGHGEEPGSDT